MGAPVAESLLLHRIKQQDLFNSTPVICQQGEAAVVLQTTRPSHSHGTPSHTYATPMPTYNDLVVMVTTVYAHLSPSRETLQFRSTHAHPPLKYNAFNDCI